MNADQSVQIQPLPREEAWDLFSKVAFKDGHVPEDIEHIARAVADECEGLPLAINVIASTMMGNRAVNEWNLALRQMRLVDSNFPIIHPGIDRDLYGRLRWSYDSLPHAHLKTCFLYCVMFPEGWYIPVHIMVHMWIAEGIVKSEVSGTLVDTANSYVKLLVDRCLFHLQTDDGEDEWGLVFGVHDVLRDMAIYIGEKEENCVSRAGRRCPDIEAVFPTIEARDNCKRLSLFGSHITSLPAKEFKCPNLVSLTLVLNFELKEIPEAFFLNLVSLKVLDLGNTGLQLLPRSLWQLKQLGFLGLNYTQIEDVHPDIGHISNLQFLHLRGCKNLHSLPCEMGDLKNLKYLDLRGCSNLEAFPCEIGAFKDLKYLDLTGCNKLNVSPHEVKML
jgi:disease resistance protein RPS2